MKTRTEATETDGHAPPMTNDEIDAHLSRVEGMEFEDLVPQDREITKAIARIDAERKAREAIERYLPQVQKAATGREAT